MSGENRKVVKISSELPVEDYIKIVLLVAEGKYDSMRQVLLNGVRKIFDEIGEEFFEEAKERNKELVETILKKAKIIERGRVRKWVLKK